MRSKRDLTTAEGVYGCALDLLAVREHGGRDMFTKLVQKGAEPDLAEAAVARLQAADLINEARYADTVYRGWLDKRYYGRQHLSLYLVKCGVAPECRQQILQEFTDELEAERAEVAAAMFRAKYARKVFADRRKLLAAAAAYMANRGFGSGYVDIILGKFAQDFAVDM